MSAAVIACDAISCLFFGASIKFCRNRVVFVAAVTAFYISFEQLRRYSFFILSLFSSFFHVSVETYGIVYHVDIFFRIFLR